MKKKLIVQISYHPEEISKKDFNKSSNLYLTISQIIESDLEKLYEISSQLKIKLDVFNISGFERNCLTLPGDQLINLLSELENKELNYISDEIKKSFKNFNDYDNHSVTIGNNVYNETLIMGILNVTPDSFSDGGKYFNRQSAAEYAVKMFEQGADIVDVGGESTRPGADKISEEKELNRVIPVIEEIYKKKPDALLSVDTTKSKVAREACKKNVKMINDISGLTFDPEIASVANEFSAALVVMHIKGSPATMQMNPVYKDLIFEIYEFLYNQTEKAKKCGVKNIIIDPGIGFGKKIEHNFEILRRLSDFKGLGYPLLIGLSRKSFLGKTLDLDMKDRDTATVVAETIALRNGAKIIRTHNVFNAVRTKKLLKLIYTK